MTDSILRSYWSHTHTSMVPFPAPPAAPLLDTYPNAALAYSLRLLRTAYAGSAIRIRRSSDDAEADIGFDANGDFDSAAAATHIGGGTGFIAKWYDQSGNGQDLTQSTAGTQPEYSATGGVDGKPSIHFVNGDDGQMFISSAPNTIFGGNTQCTCFIVLSIDSIAGSSIILDWNVSTTNRNRMYGQRADNAVYWDFGSGTTAESAVPYANISPAWEGNEHVVCYYRDSSDSQNIVIDGNVEATDTFTADLAAGNANLVLGAVTTQDSNWFYGYISEFVHWGTDLGGSRTAVQTAINTYYTVF